MADEFKSIRDNLFKALAGKTFGERAEDNEDEDGSGESAAKALIGTLFARAGKGKDEVVQTMAREIGMAMAAMLKEPLAQLAKHQKLQISFEFVPKKEGEDKEDEDDAKAKAPKTPPTAHPAKAPPAAPGRRKKAQRASYD